MSIASIDCVFGNLLRSVPRPVAGAILGAGVFAVGGGIVGLVLGLNAYPPTAWFAVLEVGIPSAIIGGMLGLVAGLASMIVKRWRAAPGRDSSSQAASLP